jgi:hypothetical protein
MLECLAKGGECRVCGVDLVGAGGGAISIQAS